MADKIKDVVNITPNSSPHADTAATVATSKPRMPTQPSKASDIYRTIPAKKQGLSLYSVIYLAMRQQIEEMAQTQKYYLEIVARLHRVNEQMDAYLPKIHEAQRLLDDAAKNNPKNASPTIHMEEIWRFNNFVLDKDGNIHPQKDAPAEVSSQTLSILLKEFEMAKTTLNGMISQESNNFQFANQKQGEVTTALTTFLKQQHEANMALNRNLLG